MVAKMLTAPYVTLRDLLTITN